MSNKRLFLIESEKCLSDVMEVVTHTGNDVKGRSLFTRRKNLRLARREDAERQLYTKRRPLDDVRSKKK